MFHDNNQSLYIKWVKKIKEEFNLDISSLPLKNDISTLHLAHLRYSSILLMEHKLHEAETKFVLKEKENQLSIFICCTDHVPSFLENNPMNQSAFYELSLHIGCENIPKYIYTLTCNTISEMSPNHETELKRRLGTSYFTQSFSHVFLHNEQMQYGQLN